MLPAHVRLPGSLLVATCVSVAALVATIVAPVGVSPIAPTIFDGRDLTGWRLPAEPHWRVVDGVLVGSNDDRWTGSVLFTERAYGDVLVDVEVRCTGGSDSGILLRRPELQVQIGFSRSSSRDMTCSFYTGTYPEEGRASRVGELWKPADFNRIRVEARGDIFTVWLNGEQVSSYHDAASRDPAPVGLQIHAGLPTRVEFRAVGVWPM